MGMEMVNNYFTNQRMGAVVGNNLLTIAKLGNRAAPVNKNNLFKPSIGFQITNKRGKRRKTRRPKKIFKPLVAEVFILERQINVQGLDHRHCCLQIITLFA